MNDEEIRRPDLEEDAESPMTSDGKRQAGGDFGHQSCKIVLGPQTSKRQRVEIVSKIMPTETGLPNDNADLARRDLLDSLDVTITSKALTPAESVGTELNPKSTGRFLVGNICNSDRYNHQAQIPSPEQRKALNPILYVTGLTALAALAVRTLPADEDTFHIGVFTVGLPVPQANEANREEVATRLTGTHTIRFHDGVGEKIGGRTIRVRVDAVKVIPEGLGAALHQIYAIDPALTLHKRRDDLNQRGTEKTYLIFDIGGLTTDVDRLRGLKFDTDNSLGLRYGVSSYLTDIVQDVRKQYGEDSILTSEAHLVEHLRNWNGVDEVSVKLRGVPKPIKDVLDRHFGILAEVVAHDIRRLWTAGIDAVFVVGGGATLVRPYLKSKLGPKYPVEIVAKDPQFQNALGNLIFSIQAAARR